MPPDLTLRPLRPPFSLEKWYVDVLMDDGTVLLVYIGQLHVLGVPMRRVTVDLFTPDGGQRRGDARVTRVDETPDRLVFGPATLTHETLRFETEALSGELVYRPRHPPATLRDPFLEDGGRTLTWQVEIPDADVEGRLSWPGGGRQVVGRGYRDRVYFDVLPWRFPIRELSWGRAAAGAHASTWVRARTRRGEIVAGWNDGVAIERANAPEVEDERVMLRAHVVDLEGLHLGALRPAMRRLVGDPHEIKWTGRTRLAGEPGLLVHEVVRWR